MKLPKIRKFIVEKVLRWKPNITHSITFHAINPREIVSFGKEPTLIHDGFDFSRLSLSDLEDLHYSLGSEIERRESLLP